MYGSHGTGVGSASLAATGLALTGWVVGAITLVFLGIALVQLARRSPADRP